MLTEDSPACLLGRDLFQALDAEIHLTPESINLIIMGTGIIRAESKTEAQVLEV